ncbi:Cof-type HAD-IIB family hydrolase [Marinilactibacillus kalidii]|uniref:Cof-type HAD-IIB family hydrolase n=1 Tax=Marinilactibacillus kalidii TaxID=2820274 RepID=UPI001FC9FCB8|nr:Cof-type HAD-IIB family hydrolase [Marinilactibacillus kalidii]
MGIKLVALDLDGTLLNKNKEVSEENRQAIQRAKEAGVKVVLCTGRPLKAILHILEACNLLEEGDLGITYNGGLIQWTQSGESLSQITMDKNSVLEIYELSKTLNVPCNFIDLNTVYEPAYPAGKDSLYPSIMNILPFKPINTGSLPENTAMNKLIFCWHQEELDQAISQIPETVHERYTIMKSRPNLLEILPKTVDKGKGLALLAEQLDLDVSEIMAIGDQENDLAMIQYAGIGVAMDNATEEVKKHADVVTKSNDDHGVAYAIEQYVLN